MNRFLSILFLLYLSLPVSAQLIINEIMQSNIDVLMDDTNQFPDSWVEVYNPDEKAVQLSDYRIGETSEIDKAWTLSGSVAAKSYQLIYCDNEGNGLHTDFRLDTSKGACLYLFYKGEMVDSLVNLPKMPAPNISYGRSSVKTSIWNYFVTPTPGKQNAGGFTKGILPDPIFSQEGCVYEAGQTITLSITLPDDVPTGTVVRYTTTGEEPNAKSNSLAAGEALTISQNTVIRAKLTCGGYISPISTVHSYIFLDRKMALPVISIVTDKRYLENDKLGIYVDGSYSTSQKNWKYDWRRPINFELFDQPEQGSVINQLCETRVAGAASRERPLKTLALYAHKRFGKKKFNYEFFPDQRPGITDFKSIMLRNAGNDFDYLYLRDALCQRVMAEHVDIDWQAWRPAIVFMNGTYKGILNIRERSNEHNIYTNNPEVEDADVVENWGSLKEGTLDNFSAFKTFYKETGHTWDEYSEWMDCDEFINLMIMDCYFCNVDFPANNITMWRPHTPDGRWRWIAKDVDYGLGIYEQTATNSGFKYIDWLYTPGYDSGANWGNTSSGTRLFRHLMDDETFARRFIDRYTIYMDQFLNYDSIWKIWEPMYEMIREEYPIHRNLYNRWWPNYGEEMGKVQNWIRERNGNVLRNLQDFYKLGELTPLYVNTSLSDIDLEGVEVFMNEIKLSDCRYNTSWYANRQLYFTSSSTDGIHSIIGWDVAVTKSGRKQVQHYDGSALAFNMPACSMVEVTAIIDDEALALPPVMAQDKGIDKSTLFDLQGRRIQQPRPGQIVVNGKRVKFKTLPHHL